MHTQVLKLQLQIALLADKIDHLQDSPPAMRQVTNASSKQRNLPRDMVVSITAVKLDRGILVLLIDTLKPKRNVWNLGCLLYIIHDLYSNRSWATTNTSVVCTSLYIMIDRY